MTDKIDSDYVESLEQAVDDLFDIWMKPLDAEVQKQDEEWADSIISKLLLSLDQLSIEEAKDTIKNLRCRVRQETLLSKSYFIDNKKLKRKLRKLGFDPDDVINEKI